MNCTDEIIKTISKKNKPNISTYGLSRRLTAIITIMAILVSLIAAPTLTLKAADKQSQTYINTHIVESDMVFNIKGIDCDYANNTYLSLRDLASYLRGKKLSFDLSIGSNEVVITPGAAYELKEGDLSLFTTEQLELTTTGTAYAPKRINMTVGSRKLRVNGIMTSFEDMDDDIYLHIADIQLYLRIPIKREGDELIIDENSSDISGFDMPALEENGYFDGYGALCVGDLESGRIFYGYRETDSLAIASVTKLMTCLCVLDAIAEGTYAYDSQIITTKEAFNLSVSGDGTFEMPPGSVTTVEDMLKCMLIASSNEAALTLAINNSGSEEEFVKVMNTKADALGLKSAHFFNASGLPVFTADSLPAKRQNTCSAEDLFGLAVILLTKYPDIVNITSTKEAYIPSFDKTVKTTNGLLYNYQEVVGLKTGSTNRAGACLVSAMEVEDTTIISVLLGAESSTDQIRTSALLLEYGRDTYLRRAGLSEDEDLLPTTEKALIQKVIDYLVRNR